MKLIDRLKELDAKNTDLSHAAEEEWNEAIHEAWPKLLAVVEAAAHARYPHGLDNLDKALAALDEEGEG